KPANSRESANPKWTGFLLRSLGLATRLEIKSAPGGGAAELSLCLHRIHGGITLQTTTTVRALPPWFPEPSVSSHNIETNERDFVTTAILYARGTPATAQIIANMDVAAGGFRFSIPFEVTLLPSIGDWYVIGPFDNPGGITLDKVFPPEKQPFN